MSETSDQNETFRVEAFSDAVLAIIVTITVLEIHVPEGGSFSDLKAILPTFWAYLLSFTFVGIYWNNHHQLFKATKKISGAVMCANIHVLFWLSLIPFVTSWVGEHPTSSGPAVLYGIIGIMAAFAYYIMVIFIKKANADTALIDALGNSFKERISLLLYAVGIGLAFVNPILSYLLYGAVSVIWFVPDRRMTQAIE